MRSLRQQQQVRVNYCYISHVSTLSSMSKKEKLTSITSWTVVITLLAAISFFVKVVVWGARCQASWVHHDRSTFASSAIISSRSCACFARGMARHTTLRVKLQKCPNWANTNTTTITQHVMILTLDAMGCWQAALFAHPIAWFTRVKIGRAHVWTPVTL